MVRTMARFNRARSPINSIKHIIDSEGAVGQAASVNVIATAVPNVDTSVFKPGDIRVGATINGFFLSVFIIGATGAPLSGSSNWYIAKTGEGQFASLPQPGATGLSKIRNQIIHEEKGVSGSGDGTPMAFKGVVAVPRGMRRMREGDQWSIVLANGQVENSTFCVKAIYKSYF